MMQTKKASLFVLMLILLFLLSPSFESSEATSDIITFSTTTADPYDIQLDFEIGATNVLYTLIDAKNKLV